MGVRGQADPSWQATPWQSGPSMAGEAGLLKRMGKNDKLVWSHPLEPPPMGYCALTSEKEVFFDTKTLKNLQNPCGTQ